jgi:hypothetical protein
MAGVKPPVRPISGVVVLFFALVAADSKFAIDLYPSREMAENALRQVLADEPEFEELLRIEPVDVFGGPLLEKDAIASHSRTPTGPTDYEFVRRSVLVARWWNGTIGETSCRRR